MGIKEVLNNYNPLTIKKNWGKVRGSPYASLRFQYLTTKWIIIALIAFVCYQLITLIIYGGGSGGWTGMAMITKLIIIVVMVLFSFKAWGMLTPLKLALKHYEESPNQSLSKEFSNIDVKSEIDDILEKFDKKGKLKEKTDDSPIK